MFPFFRGLPLMATIFIKETSLYVMKLLYRKAEKLTILHCPAIILFSGKKVLPAVTFSRGKASIYMTGHSGAAVPLP